MMRQGDEHYSLVAREGYPFRIKELKTEQSGDWDGVQH